MPRNRIIGNGEGKSAALAHRARIKGIADRLGYADPGGEGVRTFPARRVFGALFMP
jgi:hypothetical protein